MQAGNKGLAKVAVQCSADTFVVNQTLVLRINIYGEKRFFGKPHPLITPHEFLCLKNWISLPEGCSKTLRSNSWMIEKK